MIIEQQYRVSFLKKSPIGSMLVSSQNPAGNIVAQVPRTTQQYQAALVLRGNPPPIGQYMVQYMVHVHPYTFSEQMFSLPVPYHANCKVPRKYRNLVPLFMKLRQPDKKSWTAAPNLPNASPRINMFSKLNEWAL